MSYTGETTKYGQVYVNNYYNNENKKNYDPVHKGQAVGTAYIGSELDYILVDGVEDYKFGKGKYEADVGDKYTFRYYYDKDNKNYEYYEGIVYRAAGVGYYPGRIIEKNNEIGKTGY